MNVFVYGTLRKGATRSADRHFGAEFVKQDRIRAKMYDLGWYPGIILDPHGEHIVGDLFEVDQTQLEALDAYEGCPTLYQRRRIETESGMECFVYEYNGSVNKNEWIGPQNGVVDWLAIETNAA